VQVLGEADLEAGDVVVVDACPAGERVGGREEEGRREEEGTRRCEKEGRGVRWRMGGVRRMRDRCQPAIHSPHFIEAPRPSESDEVFVHHGSDAGGAGPDDFADEVHVCL
jgi:hypothetical protein